MSWQFDVITFMVLLGQEEESNYRLIRRNVLDIFATAPAAGFQSYIWGKSAITEAQGPNYISPYGGKIAPLRNMRISRLISVYDLLEDGEVLTYRIKRSQKIKGKLISAIFKHIKGSYLSAFLIATSWICFGALTTLAILLPSISWIGMTNLFFLAAWSILLRLIDRIILVPGKHTPSHPDRLDAVVILGRRHSALVLEGSRADVACWTGSGLQFKQEPWAIWLHYLSRFGTICMLLFVFCTIPNGLMHDQILFIAFSILGQINTWVGQRLNAHYTFRRLEFVEKASVSSRTHVYALLIKRFGSGEWVDNSSLLPKGEAWELWRQRITEEKRDATALWKECDAISSSNSPLSSKRSLSQGSDGSGKTFA